MSILRRIGPYEILEPLGAGAMGEVHRARDPRLHRQVALKLLPSEVADDPIRRRRFLDEARAAAGLSHPNILAVHDVGLEAGQPFIVSELLEGGRLRDEMERGPLTLRRLLDVGVQIAAGLSAAHAAGIVHRDLKPENVMITADGRVKIVDFGLAKACDAGTPVGRDAATVTLLGAIIGTPQYMSPEQASGDTADYRSDQFSLGVILYELATGVQPFRRQTAVQTMSAIVGDDPVPIAELNRRIPAVLQWIIERCLAKNPEERYASTADLARDLTTLHQRLGEVTGGAAVGALLALPARRSRALLVGVGAIVLAGGMTVLMPAEAEVGPALRFQPFVTDARFQGAPAWSPDGKAIAYVSSVDGVLQVFTKSIASQLSHPVTDCRFDCRDPFWSPDGTRIFFQSLARDAESLWSVSAAGGPPELILEDAVNASISPDGRTIAFLRDRERGQLVLGASQEIWLSSPGGADARRYMEPPFDTRTFVAGLSRFSPDGSKLLVWVWGWEDGETAPTPEFWILPFPSGKPYRVLPSLSRVAASAPSFDWFPDGRRIAVSLWDSTMTGTHLWVYDVESGSSTALTSEIGSYNRPSVSPDGRHIAFTAEAIDFDLVEVPLDGGAARPLLATSRNELDAAFTADGREYAYVSDRNGGLQIWTRSRTDARFERVVVSGNEFPHDATLALGSLAISPDRQRIAYQRYGERTGYKIWISTLAAAGPPVQLTANSLYEDGPTWSPDGAWIAFTGRTAEDVTVLSKVRVGVNERPTPILRDIPTLSGRPRWSPDGRWIVCDTTQGLVVVSPDGGSFRVISDDVWITFAWSADSRHVFGLKEGEHPRRFALAAIDIQTLHERVINPELGEIPPAFQALRGLERVGAQALVTSIASARSDIWLAEGPGLSPGRRSLFGWLRNRH